VPWLTASVAGAAVLLAGAPVQVVVQGTGWLGCGAAAVAVVVATGLVLHRTPVPVVAAGQCVAVLSLMTIQFTTDGVLGLLPGPAAVARIGELINGAGQQINVGFAPVAATPEILTLVTASFGLLTVAVHLAAVSAAAPAAAGVPLLAAFAIPAALADGLLPVGTVVAASAGYGLLLLTGTGARLPSRGLLVSRLPTAVALIGTALLLALGLGSGAGFIGTAGRFAGGLGGGGGAIGLTPFTALRGQLTDATPVELLRVRGLDRPTYIRALTLSEYVPNVGWRAPRPAPGMPLPGPVQMPPQTPGQIVDLEIENVGLYDYWLPLYGVPLAVDGLPGRQWAYDQRSGTGYALLPRQDETWRERALLPAPTAEELRRVTGARGSAPGYDSVSGVDPRVLRLAREVTAGRTNNFDRAMALQDFFTGRTSSFRYSLQTAPPAGDDALVEFLTVGRAGYCEQYASAMAVMLRAVGVPARVAVGFTGGTAVGDHRSIRTSDAHAWVEAYFPGTGWVLFDPTPLTDGRTITPDYVLAARGELGPDGAPTPSDAGGPDRLEQDRPTQLPLPAEQPVPSPGAGPESAEPGWSPWPLLVLLPLTAALLGPAAIRARQRRRRLAAVGAGGAAATEAGWREVLAESADRGVRAPSTDTVRGAARRLVREHRFAPGAQQAMRVLVGAVESSWYGDSHPGPAELAAPVRTVLTAISTGSPLSPRGWLWPRSLRTRPLRNRRTTDPRATDPRASTPDSTNAAHRN
jgi:transglutaminase-like putative cysteine protease